MEIGTWKHHLAAENDGQRLTVSDAWLPAPLMSRAMHEDAQVGDHCCQKADEHEF